MFFGYPERESLDGEFWSLWQQTKLPAHLQSLVDQEQGKRDIWEQQSQEPGEEPNHPSRDSISYDPTHSVKHNES